MWAQFLSMNGLHVYAANGNDAWVEMLITSLTLILMILDVVLPEIWLIFLLLDAILDLLSENYSYHDNAFVASRALHIVNSLDDSATFPLLEHFFKYQVRVFQYLWHSLFLHENSFEFSLIWYNI